VRYVALATDYDGTLALEGRVDRPTLVALERLRASRRRLILVTGRELDDVRDVFPEVDGFDAVVAENGALVWRRDRNVERLLADPPPPAFVQALREAGVSPLQIGRAIVSTRQPHETTVLRAIERLGLELQVIFNKGAVMVLPAGVNKRTGLLAAATELGLSPHNVVGVGDAENDHAFLTACECSAAVVNALPAIKDTADLVLSEAGGAGVAQLIDRLVADDLAQVDAVDARHRLTLGTGEHEAPISVPLHGTRLLLAGPPKAGKSHLTLTIVEQLCSAGYQFCLIDPEGDFEHLAGTVNLGDTERAPTVDEIMQVLEQPQANVVVSLLAVPGEDRPAFFGRLLPRLVALRERCGRPHWLLLDEAHHLLPAGASAPAPSGFGGVLMVTVDPDTLADGATGLVDTVCAVGDEAAGTLAKVARRLRLPEPVPAPRAPRKGEALLWPTRPEQAPRLLRVAQPEADRRRHRRKYMEGDLGRDESFYFRGPGRKLNLRARNLAQFVELADGVDDATWLFHLRRADYSRWIRDALNDDKLADEVARIEERSAREAAAGRVGIRGAIQRRYAPPTVIH
jgi:hydroxymethylpyrimidine pyrophosphatase-like HAD family hydrolase